MTTPQNSAEVAEAIGPTLDRFVLASAPMLRDCAEAVYEQLLYSVQDYLKANAEWNIGAEIDRCRKIEIENIELRATIHQLGENAAKAAAEYAAEVGRLREALDYIAHPLDHLRRAAEGRGHNLGPQAYSVATDLGFLQGIARAAITTGDVMSKTGNMRIEIQETDDYRFGWESAERGEPRPEWESGDASDRLAAQRLGWDDYHNQERSA